MADCDPSQLLNDARCRDCQIPPGYMESAMVGCALETFTFGTQPGIRGEGANEFIFGEGGETIIGE